MVFSRRESLVSIGRVVHDGVAVVLASMLASSAYATVTVTEQAAGDKTQLMNLLNAKTSSPITDSNGDNVLEIGPPSPTGDNPDTALLREAITSGVNITLSLGRNQPGVFVGAWQPPIPPNSKDTASNGTQMLDLADIKALANPHSPACGIIHELWEGFVAARDGQSYNKAHPRAIGAENTMHAKNAKDSRGGGDDPGKQGPPGVPTYWNAPAQLPRPTPTGGWYVYVPFAPEPEGPVGYWLRLRLEGRESPEPAPDGRILFGLLGPEELGPNSVPVPIDPDSGISLDDIYLAESAVLQLCNPDGNNLGCWSGCLVCNEFDAACATAVTEDPLPVVEETNFLPIHLALVQATTKINRFQEAVQDILAKNPPDKPIVPVNNVQDAIAAIQGVYDSQGPGHVVIFGHGAPGMFKIGEDDLGNPAIQGKFTAALQGKMTALTLYGCEVGQGNVGQAFLKKLTVGLQLPVHTWTGKVYAFGHDPVIPVELQNRFFVESAGEKKDIPTVTSWGMVVMVLLMLAGGTVAITRWRRLAA